MQSTTAASIDILLNSTTGTHSVSKQRRREKKKKKKKKRVW
jgi:hypothetical protein